MSRHSNLVLLTGSKFPGWLLNAGGQRAKLDIDFVNNRAWNSASVSISSLLSCTRATPIAAYYTKADGTLTTFAANTLRYGTNGLLVEEARTNLALRSQELDTAPWGAAGVTVTADQDTAPDGTLTADLISIDASGSNFHRQVNIAVSASADYIFSFYAKIGTASNIKYSVYDVTHDVDIIAPTSYNSQLNSSTYTRVAFPFTTPAGCTSINIYTSRDSTGTGTYYAWGVQLEAGAFVTSYIPTTTVSVTRAGDIVTFSSLTWFDGANDSIYAEWVVKNVNNAKVWAFDATNDKLLDEQTGMSARIAGATVANTASAAATVKAAARMALNDFAISMNGGTVATDVSETAPGTLTASRLGVDLSGTNSLNSYIRRVAAFKGVALINSALQGVST